ncbi:protein suppressor of hairy wing-like [Anopheles aquasalis]|uniref:protein suppressor of hairy wing-like n=1 Tax=Anopheles aquasalis TaxID=42839 RepID=UPI00215B5F25|nr:protein suppressor of hairy wing-like [Anopheles aquasalis]XP_050101168.1 protein suppressor of hairy wing-like [Anopheles aquasalis]
MATRASLRAAPKKKEEILVKMRINEENDIDVVPVVKDMYDSDSDSEEGNPSDQLDFEPELVETSDGRMMLELKRNKCCVRCKKPFTTLEAQKAHRSECTGVVDEMHDVIQKERKAAKYANPGEEFHKYCNPNPENPCYCCGEDVSTAHVGHIRCRLCPKSFKAYEYLDRHIKSIHAESEAYACANCNAKCCSQSVLDEHVKTHSEGKPFSCIACGKDFTRRYHLERHIKFSNCGTERKETLPCDVCGKVFTRVDNLREHLRTHMGQSVRKRDYQCPHCPKSFYGSSLLNIHIRTHTGEKPFPCDLCPSSFPSTGALRKHRRKHTGERPYRCDECSATFAARETLNRHRKTHTGDKRHVCPECGKRFIQATQLRTHIYKHTGKSDFKCGQCDMMFLRRNQLTEHIQLVHQGKEPLKCDYCDKEYLRKEDLQRHRAQHTGEKNYQCPTCLKTFALKTALSIHMKTHLQPEPVTCTICNGSFIRPDCLVRHMKAKHRVDCKELLEQQDESPVASPEVANGAMVEINGEVYQITSMDEQVAEPMLPEGVEFMELDVVAEESVETTGAATIITGDDVDSDQEYADEILETVPELVNVKQEPVVVEVKKNRTELLTKSILKMKAENTSTTSPTVANEIRSTRSTTVKVVQTTAASSSSSSIIKPEKVEPVREPNSTKARAVKSRAVPAKQTKPDDDSIPIFLSDAMLMEKISELLQMLIGEEMLKEFGWPKAPVDEVLVRVISRCGHQPAKGEEVGDHTTRMRENTKILFSVTMDDGDVKALLNNHTLDEVIMHVLKSK